LEDHKSYGPEAGGRSLDLTGVLLVDFPPALNLKLHGDGLLEDVVEQILISGRDILYDASGTKFYACLAGRSTLGVQPSLQERAVISEDSFVWV
jgi:hypothetical protein